MSRNNEQKAVYILKSKLSTYVKIGMSVNPVKRAKQIQTQSGAPLKVYYNTVLLHNPRKVEKKVHEHFKDFNEFGEWFNVSAEEAKEYLQQIESEYEKVQHVTPLHQDIERVGIREVECLPHKYDLIGEYIAHDVNGLDKDSYYIHYVYNTFDYYIKFNYLGECKHYLKKLKLYAQKIERCKTT